MAPTSAGPRAARLPRGAARPAHARRRARPRPGRPRRARPPARPARVGPAGRLYEEYLDVMALRAARRTRASARPRRRRRRGRRRRCRPGRTRAGRPLGPRRGRRLPGGNGRHRASVRVLADDGARLVLLADPDTAAQTFRGATPALVGRAGLRRAGDQASSVPRTMVLGTAWRHGAGCARCVGRRRRSAAVGARAAPAGGAAVPGDRRRARSRCSRAPRWRRRTSRTRCAARTSARRAWDRWPWSPAPGPSSSACAVPSAGAVGRGRLGPTSRCVTSPRSGRCCRAAGARRRRARRRRAASAAHARRSAGSTPWGCAGCGAPCVPKSSSGGGGRTSDALLVEALGDPARVATLPSDVVRAGRGAVARDARRGRPARAPGANAQTVLWALWAAGRAGRDVASIAVNGGPGGGPRRPRPRRRDGRVPRRGDLRRARPAGDALAFVDHVESQDLPADNLAARAGGAPCSCSHRQVPPGGSGRSSSSPACRTAPGPTCVCATRCSARRRSSTSWLRAVPGRLCAPGGDAARGAVLADELRAFAVAVSRARARCGHRRPRRRLRAVGLRGPRVSPDADGSDPARPDVARAPRPARGRRDAARRARAGRAAGRRRAGPGRPGCSRGSRVSGVAEADPASWYGSAELSSSATLRAPDESVPVSPSKVEQVHRCALRWALEAAGGTRGQRPVAVCRQPRPRHRPRSSPPRDGPSWRPSWTAAGHELGPRRLARHRRAAAGPTR